MEQKSLRQLAKELGVSASYLSQVRNGKRPASHKVLSMLSNFRQDGGSITHDLASETAVAARRAHNPEVVGSNPTPATKSLP